MSSFFSGESFGRTPLYSHRVLSRYLLTCRSSHSLWFPKRFARGSTRVCSATTGLSSSQIHLVATSVFSISGNCPRINHTAQCLRLSLDSPRSLQLEDRRSVLEPGHLPFGRSIRAVLKLEIRIPFCPVHLLPRPGRHGRATSAPNGKERQKSFLERGTGFRLRSQLDLIHVADPSKSAYRS